MVALKLRDIQSKGARSWPSSRNAALQWFLILKLCKIKKLIKTQDSYRFSKQLMMINRLIINPVVLYDPATVLLVLH